ncbi:hypothetical protein CsSME_00012430 [Camellia sinensis var. sinensis]
MGLNSKFESLQTHSLNTSPAPSLYEAFATINSDERRTYLVQPNPSPLSPISSNRMALVAKSGSRGSTGPVTCHHCGVSSHVKARCFKLHPELRQCSSRPHGAGTPHTAALAQLGSLTASSPGPSSTTATTLAISTSAAFLYSRKFEEDVGKGYERDGLYYFGDPSDEPSSSSLASF